jgi:hypothetical protein
VALLRRHGDVECAAVRRNTGVINHENAALSHHRSQQPELFKNNILIVDGVEKREVELLVS